MGEKQKRSPPEAFAPGSKKETGPIGSDAEAKKRADSTKDTTGKKVFGVDDMDSEAALASLTNPKAETRKMTEASYASYRSDFFAAKKEAGGDREKTKDVFKQRNRERFEQRRNNYAERVVDEVATTDEEREQIKKVLYEETEIDGRSGTKLKLFAVRISEIESNPNAEEREELKKEFIANVLGDDFTPDQASRLYNALARNRGFVRAASEYEFGQRAADTDFEGFAKALSTGNPDDLQRFVENSGDKELQRLFSEQQKAFEQEQAIASRLRAESLATLALASVPSLSVQSTNTLKELDDASLDGLGNDIAENVFAQTASGVYSELDGLVMFVPHKNPTNPQLTFAINPGRVGINPISNEGVNNAVGDLMDNRLSVMEGGDDMENFIEGVLGVSFENGTRIEKRQLITVLGIARALKLDSGNASRVLNELELVPLEQADFKLQMIAAQLDYMGVGAVSRGLVVSEDMIKWWRHNKKARSEGYTGFKLMRRIEIDQLNADGPSKENSPEISQQIG